jgi:hypothetical protein
VSCKIIIAKARRKDQEKEDGIVFGDYYQKQSHHSKVPDRCKINM